MEYMKAPVNDSDNRQLMIKIMEPEFAGRRLIHHRLSSLLVYLHFSSIFTSRLSSLLVFPPIYLSSSPVPSDFHTEFCTDITNLAPISRLRTPGLDSREILTVFVLSFLALPCLVVTDSPCRLPASLSHS
jgi:hypothetical protein